MIGEPDGHEEILAGGNMTAVVRVGDTVRRAAGPWTPTIHAFMHHLCASGFQAVPEPLGIDDRGQEIISFLPRAAATYPLPDFAWSDATLTAVAQCLRAFHDASLGFVPPADCGWQWPAHEPAEVICHNDFAPYNLMFEDGKLTGVIDLDLASPGPRVWDMAYTAYRFVPLTDLANPDAPFPGLDEQHGDWQRSAPRTPTRELSRPTSWSPRRPSSASSSRSSSARPPPATLLSRRCWREETSSSTGVTSLTSSNSRSADRRHVGGPPWSRLSCLTNTPSPHEALARDTRSARSTLLLRGRCRSDVRLEARSRRRATGARAGV